MANLCPDQQARALFRGLGRWAFLEIADIYDAGKAIRDFLAVRKPGLAAE